MSQPTPGRIPLRIQGLLIAFFLSAFAKMGQITIIGKQVYDLTGRELDLGLIGLAEFLPAMLVAPLAGAIADRVDRRQMFAFALSGEALVSALLFWYATTEPTSILPIFWLVFLFGLGQGFTAASGRALPIDMSPTALFPRVVALEHVAFQAGLIVGPVTFGFLFVVAEPLPYLTAALGLATATLILIVIPSASVRQLDTVGVRQAVVDAILGMRFIRRTPVLFGVISLDLFAVLFGGAVALLPAIAEDRLGVGAIGLGWLRAAVGIGAGIVAVALSIRPIQRHIGRTLLSVVAIFGVGTIVLGLSRNYLLAFIAIMVLAGADAVSMFIRLTIVPLATPENMRGRVLALENVFIGASNELGAFESGVTAALLGLTGAIVFGGIGTLAVVALWSILFPTLRDVDRFDEVTTSPQVE
ncbi:MAG: MFS transporter [Acidimicrobiales bacterium]|nr:MFS transporter [Acidimicrobiaceae bacterium]MDP6077192.1 MFS transporter [Acidimicrobiales bacterium]HCV35876.1 MFS transporter [Acidimicrobiaceae bacterium]HJO80490.1 MFS transporter [Acidimicrobiales bacterium]